MYGLRDEFGDEIQFIWLNVDSAITLPLREQYGIVHRTNYVLVDATGAVHSRWFGYLNDDELSTALQTFLDEQS